MTTTPCPTPEEQAVVDAAARVFQDAIDGWWGRRAIARYHETAYTRAIADELPDVLADYPAGAVAELQTAMRALADSRDRRSSKEQERP